jgi:hypothetical protein
MILESIYWCHGVCRYFVEDPLQQLPKTELRAHVAFLTASALGQ